MIEIFFIISVIHKTHSVKLTVTLVVPTRNFSNLLRNAVSPQTVVFFKSSEATTGFILSDKISESAFLGTEWPHAAALKRTWFLELWVHNKHKRPCRQLSFQRQYHFSTMLLSFASHPYFHSSQEWIKAYLLSK